MKTKGKAWQLVVTALLIVVFVYTAFFGVAAKYGDVTTTYIKGAKDIRFGVDIKGGVNVTFVPSDGYDATDEQLDAARLVIDRKELDKMSGKRVLVVDDVISTGGSLKALDKLAEQTQCTIVGQAAVLAEGDAAQRKDIIFLEPLPLFLH